jgi:hypothetical protein
VKVWSEEDLNASLENGPSDPQAQNPEEYPEEDLEEERVEAVEAVGNGQRSLSDFS